MKNSFSRAREKNLNHFSSRISRDRDSCQCLLKYHPKYHPQYTRKYHLLYHPRLHACLMPFLSVLGWGGVGGRGSEQEYLRFSHGHILLLLHLLAVVVTIVIDGVKCIRIYSNIFFIELSNIRFLFLSQIYLYMYSVFIFQSNIFVFVFGFHF